MFSQVWNKYLPVIKILLKRSSSGDQTLNMNQTDFQRASGGRKVRYTFGVQVHRGKMENPMKQTPLAKEFVALLMEDNVTREYLKEQHVEFHVNTNFQLLIKNITSQVDGPPPDSDADQKNIPADNSQT